MIQLDHVSFRYGETRALQDVSLTVKEGEFVGVIGPNSSGKSTLLQILQGRAKPDSGDLAIRKGTRLSYVAQVSEFAETDTPRSVVEAAMQAVSIPPEDR